MKPNFNNLCLHYYRFHDKERGFERTKLELFLRERKTITSWMITAIVLILCIITIDAFAYLTSNNIFFIVTIFLLAFILSLVEILHAYTKHRFNTFKRRDWFTFILLNIFIVTRCLCSFVNYELTIIALDTMFIIYIIYYYLKPLYQFFFLKKNFGI